MSMFIKSAELTDKDENGFQGVILWGKGGAAIATLKVETWAGGLEPYAREAVMCDLLDVLIEGVAPKEATKP